MKKNLGGFFIGSSAQAALQFFTIPLLIRALGATDYGQWALIEPILLISCLIAQWGANWGVLKLINSDNVNYKNALYTAVIQSKKPAALVSVAVSVFSYFYFNSFVIAVLFPFVVCSELILSISLSVTRATQRSFIFSIGIIVKFGLLAFFASVSAFLLKENSVSTAAAWLAIYLVCTATSAIVTFALLFFQGENTAFINDVKMVKTLRDYGTPIMVAAILVAIMGNLDRYLISIYFPSEVLGVYIVALKLAGAINFLVTPFSLWWPTARFIHIKDSDRGQYFFSSIAVKVTLFFSVSGSLLWFLSKWILPYFAGNIYVPSGLLLPLIIGGVIRAIEPCFAIGLLQEGKTKFLIYSALITTILQILLSFLAMTYFQAVGVAWSLCLVSLISIIGNHISSQRIYNLSYPYISCLFALIVPFVVVYNYAN